jgi:HEAT repeat protein
LSVDEAAVASLIKIADDRSTRVPQGASIRLTWYLDGGNGNRIERRAQNEYLRVGAIQALGGFGERAAPAVPVLIEALRTDDWLRQWYATEALAQIGPKAKAAVPELIARVRTKRDFPIPTGTTVRNEPMRTPYGLDIAAIKALGQIGPDARAAIPVLNDVLKGSDKAVRAEAAQALELIKSNPKAADPEQ